MKHLVEARVVGANEVAREHYIVYLEAPPIAEEARPGQFVMARPEAQGTLLGRPLGVARVNRERGRIALLIRVRGKGTHSLVHMSPDSAIVVWGPLGNGYTLPSGGEQIMLIAGGYGVAPLLFMAEESVRAGARVATILGVATRERIAGEDLMRRVGAQVEIATEDGSAGFHGVASELAEQTIKPETARVHACGPAGMSAVVARLCAERAVACEVSMEEHMACGVGACMGCPVPALPSGYKMVCSDGPVFDATQIDWARLEAERGGF